MFDIDVAIVGGGVQGTALGRTIQHFIPSLSQLTIDPVPPLSLWIKRTEAIHMRTLRSPASHSLDYNFRSLLSFARGHNYPPSHLRSPYTRPSLSLFLHHSSHVLGLLKREWLSAKVIGIQQKSTKGFLLQTTSGDVSARFVILAPGKGDLIIPHWGKRDWHVFHEDFKMNEDPASLCIVGAGLSAANLCVHALSCNIPTIYMFSHTPLHIAHFDSNPCYIGPACASKFFELSDYQARKNLIDRERYPGSIPPWMYKRLKPHIDSGRIRLIIDNIVQVQEPSPDTGPNYYIETERSGSIQAAELALATGIDPLPVLPFLNEYAHSTGGKRIYDYPIPDKTLAWSPGLFLSGALAELEIGPAALNIIGGHLAARRIVPALREAS